MKDLQLQLQLKKYKIKSSFSGASSPEEPLLSPYSFQPQPKIFSSAHWHTSPRTMKTTLFLTLLLAGFTLMALLAYGSPLPSPATLHNDPNFNSGDNPSAPVISKSASALNVHSTSPAGLLSIHTDPGTLSTQNRKIPSNSTHSNLDSQGSQRGASGSNGEDSAPGDWDAAFARENQEARQGGGRTAPANSEVHGGGVH